MLIDNKENIESVLSNTTLSQEKVDSIKSDKEKEKGNHSSTPNSLPSSPPPTKTDIEKLEQREDRKFSAEIDAISEKLYHMNNMVKMNKDLETLAKENLVKSDIMKKLTLKEKWLAEGNPANKTVLPPKSKFEEKIDAIKSKSVEKEQKSIENDRKLTVEEVLKELKPRTPDFNSPRLSALTSNQKPKKMEYENVLDIVKDIDLGKVDMEDEDDDENKDIGKLLYDIQNREDMANKMKEIETKNFAGTMDLIKSQMIEPNISAQANSNIDLAKYFPNQKQDKVSAGATNKNQKNLKDVDLAKYFPTSPLPSRKSSVVTVAEKLKRSSTEKSVPTTIDPEKKKVKDKKLIKRGDSFNLRDHQLDGAVDLPIKPKPVRVTTSAATATATKKGNVKIIKTKGTKGKKSTGKKLSIPTSDDADDLLDEIWRAAEEEMGSPSLEYQDLFKEEKSPSEDISDKMEGILEEFGIDVGKKRRKKITKAKSFAEGDLKYSENNYVEDTRMDEQDFDDEDRPKGVQNILKRFESLRSVKPEEAATKLPRTESTNRSRESLVSQESVVSISDLEKTMDYLKTEWRNEATNFLQMKREKFFGQKRTADIDKENVAEEKQKKTKIIKNEEPKESKFASFFGIGIKGESPEKNTQLQKSPKSSALPLKKHIVKEDKKVQNLAKTNKNQQLEPNAKGKPQPNNSMLKNVSTPNTKKCENLSFLQDESEQLLNRLEKERSIKNKNDLSNELLQGSTTALDLVAEVEHVETRVENIKNLPKTGCDKSQNNSRRGSLQSLGSRRCSNSSIIDKLEDIENTQLDSSDRLSKNNIDELFDKIVTEFDGSRECVNSKNTDPVVTLNGITTPTILETKDEECDSLCTTISKSPSCEGLGVKLRGSSEDRSIENLFSRFTDEMLVNVEFDSNDELLSITPTITEKTQINKASQKEIIENIKINKQFPPQKPQRRSKSSSSSDSCIPVPPQRLKKKLSTLNPCDMPPSMQDKRKQSILADDKTEDWPTDKFPLGTERKIIQKQEPSSKISKFPENIELSKNKDENSNADTVLENRRLSKDSRDSIRQLPPQSPSTYFKNTTESLNTESDVNISTSIQNIDEHIKEFEKSPTKETSVNSFKTSMIVSKEKEKNEMIVSKEREKNEMNLDSKVKANNQTIPTLVSSISEKTSNTNNIVMEEQNTSTEINKEENLGNNVQKGYTNIDLSELKNLGEKRRLIEAKYKERRSSKENNQDIDETKLNNTTHTCKNDQHRKNIEAIKEKSPIIIQNENIITNTDIEKTSQEIIINEASKQKEVNINDTIKPIENKQSKNIKMTVPTKSTDIKELQQKKIIVTSIESEQYEKLRKEELFEREKQYRKMEEEIKNLKEEKVKNIECEEKEKSISPEKIIELFERERRLSLIERDKEYQEKVKIEDWYKPPEVSNSVVKVEHEKSSSVEPVSEIFKDRQWPDGVTDFTKIQEEKAMDDISLEIEEEVRSLSKEKSKSKENSWNMDEVPASPMPRSRFVHKTTSPPADQSPQPETEECIIVKALEQERRLSLIERERIYQDRKDSNTSILDNLSLSSLKSSTTGTPQSDDNKMLDLQLQSHKNSSPSGSMNLLNNLAQNEQELEQQLLKQHEAERRKSLIKRELEYATKVTPLDLYKDKNEDLIKSRMTTPSTQSKVSTPFESRRASPVREGTPPMFKKLDITNKTSFTPQSSRRPSSSFAILEHLEQKEPVIAPMPKKLEFPKVVPKFLPEKETSQDPVAEVFQNRPWPKAELDTDDEEEELAKNENDKESQPNFEICYPLPEVFKNRQWPDGVTQYGEKQRANSLEPQSQTTNNRTISKQHKTEPKSFAEMVKQPSTHNSVQSLPQTTARSPRSSVDSDNYGFARPSLRYGAESVDASTRMLLNRSKHLHDRKCDFLNEREGDRNSYKKPVESVEERLGIYDDHLRSYRPRSYAGSTRFPSSSDVSRRNRYDYLSSNSSIAPISDYSSSSRILPTSSIGLGYHVPTVTSSGLNTLGRSAHLTDYYRRSPSRHRESSSRDSCVII